MSYLGLSYISAFSILIPILTAILNFRTFNLTLKVLFYFLCASAMFEVVGYYFYYNRINNAFVFFIYNVVEGLFIIWLYYTIFESTMLKHVLRILFILYLTLAVLVQLGYISYEVLSATESLVILSLCVYYFYTVIAELSIPVLTDYYFFWINSALLFYFGTNLFISFFENYIRYLGNQAQASLWSIHLISGIIFNLLLAMGIWKARTK